MIMKKLLLSAALLLSLIWLPPSLRAAATDGTATLSVTLSDPSGNYNRRVDAYWVTDATGKFVQTVRKDAANRQQYLYKWIAARGSYTAVDGFSGATISTWGTFTVTWDCRDTNNVIVPDGDYRFYVEMTDYNGQGNWTTNGLTFTKGTVASTNTYPDQPYITNKRVVYTPIATPHDVAVASLTPPYLNPNASSLITVTLTNRTTNAETFSVTLSNLTSGTLLGAASSVALPANAKTNLLFTWDTSALALGSYLLQASVVLTNDTVLGNNTLSSAVTLRNPTHDLDLDIASVPIFIQPYTTSNVVLSVANSGDFTESFVAVLYDETADRLIYSNQIANLPAQTLTNLTVSWNALNAALGYHTLRATAGPVAGELPEDQADNVHHATVLVANGVTNVVLIATNSLWRYNDTGVDLSATPWGDLNYYDDNWGAGQSPLGYAEAAYTNNFNKQVGYGPNANAKYITTYFRKTFAADFKPAALSLRLLRDDGFVLYLNGVEILRNNMDAGTVTAATLATNTVNNPETFTYNTYLLSDSVRDLFVPGLNQIAIEVHQVTANSSDLSMSMELIATLPSLPVVHDVAVARVEPAGDALAGELLPIQLALTNRGTATETFTVYLVNTNNNQILASRGVTNLVAGGVASVQFNWKTLGLAPGTYGLKAYTVTGTTTNTAGVAFGVATISGAGTNLLLASVMSAVGGRCSTVASDGFHTLAGAGATLLIFDAANPTGLVQQSSLRLPGMIEGLVLAGTNAYVMCGPAGVQIVSLADPAAPAHIGSFDTAGHAYAARINGNYLYVAAGRAGLKILNVSNPAAPTLTGGYVSEGPIKAIQSSGIAGFALDQHLGLLVLNLGNPANPVLMATLKFAGGMDLAVSGTRGYTIDASGKFQVINLQSPSAPALLHTLQLNAGFCRALAVSDYTVYVAAEDAGIVTVNAAAAPVATATNTATDSVIALTAGGGVLYAADSFAGLKVFDLSTPTAPVLAASVATGTRAADVVLQNDLAYVAAGESGLRIYRVANPANPQLIGAFTGVNNARSVAVAGSLAYVGEGQGGFKVVNISDPANPTLAGAYAHTNLGCARALAATTTRALLTDGGKVWLFDVTTPANPTLLSTYPVPGFGLGMAISGNTACVAAGSAGVILLDFASGTLNRVGLYDTPGVATSVAVSGNLAYVADGPGGWLALDISTPASPSLLSQSSAQGPVSAIGATPNLTHLSAGGGLVQVMDVSVPLTPVPQQTLGPLVSALRLAASGNVAIAADDAAGLAVLSTGAGDVNHNNIPDDWEQQIVNASLATNGPIHSLNDVRAGDDFDGDGLSNLHEYLAGTSPVDPKSVFALQAPAQDAAGSPALIRWHSAPGKLYTLYQSTNLAAGFTVLQADIPATPPLNTFTNAANGQAAFYLISVK